VDSLVNTIDETPDDASNQYGLTSREIQILRHLALGKSDGDISLELKISVKTVGTHVSKIILKLGVNNRTHAVAKALIVHQIEMRASDSSATSDKPNEKRKIARTNTLKIKGMPVMRVDDE
jgi:DNA-binding CsgD family transcriptional regulator